MQHYGAKAYIMEPDRRDPWHIGTNISHRKPSSEAVDILNPVQRQGKGTRGRHRPPSGDTAGTPASGRGIGGFHPDKWFSIPLKRLMDGIVIGAGVKHAQIVADFKGADPRNMFGRKLRRYRRAAGAQCGHPGRET